MYSRVHSSNSVNNQLKMAGDWISIGDTVCVRVLSVRYNAKGHRPVIEYVEDPDGRGG